LTTGTTPLNSFTDGINLSVIMAWLVIVWQLPVKYRQIHSVGNYGMTGNCLATLCEIPTEIIPPSTGYYRSPENSVGKKIIKCNLRCNSRN